MKLSELINEASLINPDVFNKSTLLTNRGKKKNQTNIKSEIDISPVDLIFNERLNAIEGGSIVSIKGTVPSKEDLPVENVKVGDSYVISGDVPDVYMCVGENEDGTPIWKSDPEIEDYQANWNAEEGEKGHVLNRPFGYKYIKTAEVQIEPYSISTSINGVYETKSDLQTIKVKYKNVLFEPKSIEKNEYYTNFYFDVTDGEIISEMRITAYSSYIYVSMECSEFEQGNTIQIIVENIRKINSKYFESSMSDWNQSDSSQYDYIRNRICYYDKLNSKSNQKIVEVESCNFTWSSPFQYSTSTGYWRQSNYRSFTYYNSDMFKITDSDPYTLIVTYQDSSGSHTVSYDAYHSKNSYSGEIDLKNSTLRMTFFFSNSNNNVNILYSCVDQEVPEITIKKLVLYRYTNNYAFKRIDDRYLDLDNRTIIQNKVDKEDGKGLSSNDFTDYYIDAINKGWQYDKYTRETSTLPSMLYSPKEGYIRRLTQDIIDYGSPTFSSEIITSKIKWLTVNDIKYILEERENANLKWGYSYLNKRYYSLIILGDNYKGDPEGLTFIPYLENNTCMVLNSNQAKLFKNQNAIVLNLSNYILNSYGTNSEEEIDYLSLSSLKISRNISDVNKYSFISLSEDIIQSSYDAQQNLVALESEDNNVPIININGVNYTILEYTQCVKKDDKTNKIYINDNDLSDNYSSLSSYNGNLDGTPSGINNVSWYNQPIYLERSLSKNLIYPENTFFVYDNVNEKWYPINLPFEKSTNLDIDNIIK